MSENWYCTGCGSTSYPWHHPFCTGPRPVVPAAPSGEPNDPDTLALLHIEQILTAHYGSVQREISYAVLRAAGAASVPASPAGKAE